MKLGIKVGLKGNSLQDVDITKAPYAEVWYDASKPDAYHDLFNGLKKRHVDVGLHYWGALSDGTWTNIAYPDSDLISASMALMKQTIEVAARNHFSYVNIHPGCRAKIAINYEAESFTVLEGPDNELHTENIFLENAKILREFAIKNGVLFTVETVPPRVHPGRVAGKMQTSFAENIYELPLSAIHKIASSGIAVANDFGHTAANLISEDPNAIYAFLLNQTEQLAPYTRLIHLGYLVPPYNGTDNHDMLDNPIFDTSEAIPNRNQMLELFGLFKNRPDIYIIVEPKADHPKNYFLARELLKIAGCLDE